MKKSRFTEEKIIAVLAEQERGMGTAEVCRKHGIPSCDVLQNGRRSSAGWTFPRRASWKTLETENARLKKLLADAMLDNAFLKDLLGNS
jgi:putative transposase